jgi:hypothetical protein
MTTPNADSTVSSYTDEAFKRWRTALDLETSLAGSWRQVMEDTLSRFQLWARNMGAHHAADDKRSADYRLRTVPEALDRVRQLVGELLEEFDDILDILSEKRDGEVEEISDHDTSQAEPLSEISELWRMVGGTVTNLMKVSVLIRDGTCRDRYEYALRAAARGNNTAVTGWDVDHVMAKYPKLERRRGLVQRLGEANTDRRHFLTYLRDHRDRLAGEEPRESGTMSISTRATTLTPARINLSALDTVDNFEGDDVISAMSATTYFTSDGDQEGGGSLRVLPLSSVCLNEMPGLCPYCQRMVLFRSRKAWR